MSWRTVATVLIVVFAVVVLQQIMIGPLYEIANLFSGSGSYDNTGHFDGNAVIESMPGHWANMGLLLVMGLIVWAIARAVHKELTRGRAGP